MAERKFKAFDTALTALMTAVIVVCSLAAVPFGSVPITLQTFAICVSVGLLGVKRGVVCVLLYLLLGIAGLPVFSGFQGGIGVLLGPTGGYVLGFIPMVIVSGLIIQNCEKKAVVHFLAFVAGLIVCYFVGTIWFVYVYSVEKTDFLAALSVCVLPYVIPDVVKLILASVLIRSVNERIKI